MLEFIPIPQPRSNLLTFYISVGLQKIVVGNQKQVEQQNNSIM